MRSELVVTVAAEDLSLVSAATLRAAAGLAPDDASRDEQLATLGLRIAAEIASACGIAAGKGNVPTLRRETLSERFDLRADEELLFLSRRHNIEIVSLLQDQDALSGDSYSVDSETGMMERRGGPMVRYWRRGPITVVYRAGFDLDDVPADLEGAVVDLVRLRLSEQSRDPLLRSEANSLDGVSDLRRDYWVGGLAGAGAMAGIPAHIAERLGRYRSVSVC
jgi:hypothetical protein